MHLLTPEEALHVSDSFLSNLYGEEIFSRWKELKDDMMFNNEREYVSWLIDVAQYYRRSDEQKCAVAEDYYSVETKNTEDLLTECGNSIDNESTRFLLNIDSSSIEPSESIKVEGRTKTEKCEQNSMSEYPASPKSNGKPKSSAKLFSTVSYVGETDYSGDASVNPMATDNNFYSNKEDVIVTSEDDETEDEQYHPQETDYSHCAGSETLENKLSKKHNCPHCTFRSDHYHNIKRHIQSIHQNLKQFSCKHCNYKSAMNSTLKAHLINKHGYASKYPCVKCGKYFVKPSALERHVISCG